MRVEATDPNLRLFPLISMAAVKRLQEAFPEARPFSRTEKEAFEVAMTVVPGRSVSSHSVPVSEGGFLKEASALLRTALWRTDVHETPNEAIIANSGSVINRFIATFPRVKLSVLLSSAN